MTLGEFVEYVAHDDLHDNSIHRRWHMICHILSEMSVDQVKAMAKEGYLDSLVTYEEDDGFGTEGMRL